MTETKEPVAMRQHRHRPMVADVLSMPSFQSDTDSTHADDDSTVGDGFTEYAVWHHLSPWGWNTCDEANGAIVTALKRICAGFEASHDAVRLANELLQFAAELAALESLAEAM